MRRLLLLPLLLSVAASLPARKTDPRPLPPGADPRQYIRGVDVNGLLDALNGSGDSISPVVTSVGGSPVFTGTPTGDFSGVTVKAAGAVTARSTAERFADTVNPLDDGAKCDGATDDRVALQASQTRAGSTKGIVITCKVRIAGAAGTITVPVRFEGGGSLDLQTGGSITLSGELVAGLHRIFYTSGGTLTFSPKVSQVYPQWWGAKGDGTTNDTAAVAAAYAALPTNGSELFFPAGDYKFNLAITRNGVTIKGAGSMGDINHNVGATLFRPADTTKPLITWGDGTNMYRGGRLTGVSLTGDGAALGTGDGVQIWGFFDLTMDHFSINNFNRHGVYLRPGTNATANTSGIHLSSCQVAGSAGSDVYADYGAGGGGGSYTTHVGLSDCHLQGGAAGTFSLYDIGVDMTLTNIYVDANGSGQGHTYLKAGASTQPRLRCNGASFDNVPGGASATTIELDSNLGTGATHKVSQWVNGRYSVVGQAKFNFDPASYPQAGMGGATTNHWLDGAMVISHLDFPADEAGAAAGLADVYLKRSGAAGSAALTFYGLSQLVLSAPTLTFNGAGAQTFQCTTTGCYWYSYSKLAAGDSHADYTLDTLNTRNSGDVIAQWRNNGTLLGNVKGNGAWTLPSASVTTSTTTKTLVVTPVIYNQSGGGTLTIDASTGTMFTVNATDGTAFTLAAPSNPVTGQIIFLRILNASGGTMGVITWDAAWSHNLLAVGNGLYMGSPFIYDGAKWKQFGTAASGSITN